MPIEIRELIIKVSVHDDSHRPAPAPTALSAAGLALLRRELTESCVRQVLAQLRQRPER